MLVQQIEYAIAYVKLHFIEINKFVGAHTKENSFLLKGCSRSLTSSHQHNECPIQ